MMKSENTTTLVAVLLTLLLTTALALPPATAQEHQRWELPEGATLRLGKGTVNELAYSPDGTLLVVVSSSGCEFYRGVALRCADLSRACLVDRTHALAH